MQGLGWAAAAYQSAFGVNWVFSGLQSAAMAGYGAPVVNGIIRGAVLAGMGITEAFKWAGNNTTT